MATSDERGRGRLRSAAVAPANWTERLSEQGFAYVLLLPTLLLVSTMALWPLVSTFEMSLRADALFSAEYVGEFVGFENYVELLTGERNAILGSPFLDFSQPFQSALTVTLIYVAIAVTLETIIGFGQALVLDQSFRGRRWVRVAILIPWAVPIAIQGLIFWLFFQPGIGVGTDVMRYLGIFSENPLINTTDTLIIVIVADVWKTSAFMALLILAGLQSVDRSLYDVAKVAGASKIQQFRYITFPLVLPALLVALLFRTIQSMRVYGIIETTGGCSTLPSLTCLVVSTFRSGRYATSAAVAFITAGIVALVAMVYIVKFADLEVGT
ncbi:carbohydrate ABC transporter permease [Halosimplex pelagicum]|uniref:Sugar ABC transporter permease n=1 Tax=Halosimplex pelagicum TaxID=869886 RepID=A0A7D5TCG1_9EURY|nr:sugar ABC transporter permease [Halosimplex pelagicum]QLH84590.1 sugar ABC transporter permease [Halosimplex pelagicum]